MLHNYASDWGFEQTLVASLAQVTAKQAGCGTGLHIHEVSKEGLQPEKTCNAPSKRGFWVGEQ